jgi:hypothetical protein
LGNNWLEDASFDSGMGVGDCTVLMKRRREITGIVFLSLLDPAVWELIVSN